MVEFLRQFFGSDSTIANLPAVIRERIPESTSSRHLRRPLLL